MQQRWPDRLWIVRHGQSAGNVVSDRDRERQMDVILSPLGQDQAMALGRWFAGRPDAERPRVLMTSPHRLAVLTSQFIRDNGGMAARNLKIRVDERLRGQDLGGQDQGPEQAELRRLMGKFYHRPPGGESWCDVILRLRGVLDTLSLHHGGDHVMIVADELVMLSLRYVLEGLTETQILSIEHTAGIAHCGITEYRFGAKAGEDDGLVLARHNFTAPLEQQGALVTAGPGANIANLMGGR